MAGAPPGWDRRGVHMDRVGSENQPVATRHSRSGPPDRPTAKRLRIYFAHLLLLGNAAWELPFLLYAGKPHTKCFYVKSAPICLRQSSFGSA